MVKYDKQGRMKYNPELHFSQGQKWNKEDTEYLINWYHIIGAEEMSLALGRSEQTIYDKVCKLKKKGLMPRVEAKHNTRLLRGYGNGQVVTN